MTCLRCVSDKPRARPAAGTRARTRGTLSMAVTLSRVALTLVSVAGGQYCNMNLQENNQ